MPSGCLLRLHAHAPQILHHRVDAVRLLDAQLCASRTVSPSSVAAPSTASTGISSISAAVSALGNGAAAQLRSTPPRFRPSARRSRLSRFGMRILAPMPRQKIEQRRARRDSIPRRGWSAASPAPAARPPGKTPPRKDPPAPPVSRPSRRGRPASAICGRSTVRSAPNSRSAISVWSRERTGSVTVVSPFREQAGEQHARLHLRARHRQRVIDRPQRAGPRSPAAETVPRAPGCDAPICAERLHDAPHGPPRKRFVPEDAAPQTAALPEFRRACEWSSRNCPRPDPPPARAARRARGRGSSLPCPRLFHLDAQRLARTPAWNGNPRRWNNSGSAWSLPRWRRSWHSGVRSICRRAA